MSGAHPKATWHEGTKIGTAAETIVTGRVAGAIATETEVTGEIARKTSEMAAGETEIREGTGIGTGIGIAAGSAGRRTETERKGKGAVNERYAAAVYSYGCCG